MEEKLKSVGATITGVKKKMSTWAKGVALTGNRNKEKGWEFQKVLTVRILDIQK